MDFSHKPVLFHQTIASLGIKPDGVYLDGTAGGGGHSAGILQQLGSSGRLINYNKIKFFGNSVGYFLLGR